ALQLLAELAHPKRREGKIQTRRQRPEDIALLRAADLVNANGAAIEISTTGLAYLAQRSRTHAAIDPFRTQHLDLTERVVQIGDAPVTVDQAESPLAWLARRNGRAGRALIEPVQFQAGERLRADFTRSQLMPRTTSNWSATVQDDR